MTYLEKMMTQEEAEAETEKLLALKIQSALRGMAEKFGMDYETAMKCNKILKGAYGYNWSKNFPNRMVLDVLAKPWEGDPCLPFSFKNKEVGEEITDEERELVAFFAFHYNCFLKFEELIDDVKNVASGRPTKSILWHQISRIAKTDAERDELFADWRAQDGRVSCWR